uniref:FLYWCH-type domain-containing protein n=1 Tax=Globodera rostochiensis TaxID=31243 RepID=A0A914IBX8_GLORO
MSNVRKKLEQLQKANKRQRISTAAEDSILNERVPTEQTAQPAADDQAVNEEGGDEENRQPVQFQRGKTIRGELCLWYQGYRYVRQRMKWFRCEQKTICQATAKLEDEELLTGYLGPKEHNHGAAPLTTEWRRHMDNLRQVDKQVDIGRAERLQKSTTRKPKYVIKELNVVRILDGANFDTDDGLMDAIDLLGLVMQGYVEGLHIRGDEESGNDTSEEEN